MRNFFIFISSVFVLLLTACNSPFLPKEKGYANFKFPEKTYQSFNAPNSPYTFEYPTYAFVDNQINYFGENKSKDAWINIQFTYFIRCYWQPIFDVRILIQRLIIATVFSRPCKILLAQ